MTIQQLEHYKSSFATHFQDYILIADLDSGHNLIAYATPYCNFEEIVMEVCEGLPDTIDFNDHLSIYLYQFGRNEYVRIGIN